jgi:hypothetical protein
MDLQSLMHNQALYQRLAGMPHMKYAHQTVKGVYGLYIHRRQPNL